VNSFSEMAAEVSALLNNPERRKDIGAAGQQLYCERFQIKHTIEKLRGGTAVTPSSVAR